MTIMVPIASKQTLASFALGVATPGNQIFRLFVNNITPALTDTAATYREMSTLGYAAISLNKASWVQTATGGIDSSGQAQITWTFTAGTAVTVYGYFVTDTTTGLLLWSELAPSPTVVQNTGDQIKITPTITFT